MQRHYAVAHHMVARYENRSAPGFPPGVPARFDRAPAPAPGWPPRFPHCGRSSGDGSTVRCVRRWNAGRRLRRRKRSDRRSHAAAVSVFGRSEGGRGYTVGGSMRLRKVALVVEIRHYVRMDAGLSGCGECLERDRLTGSPNFEISRSNRTQNFCAWDEGVLLFHGGRVIVL